MGQSAGHWEGDTLVVDVTGFERPDLVRSRGRFSQRRAARGGALHAAWSRTILKYEATIEDPRTFSRGRGKSACRFTARLEKNAQLMEFKCVEFVEELMYGQYRKKAAK